MTGPIPSSPSKIPVHFYDDMDDTRDDSTRATSNLRTSCIGFSTPSQASKSERPSRLSTGGQEPSRRQSKLPKFNLEQDSLVKKTADTFNIYDEENQDGLPALNYLNMDQNQVSKFNIATIGSLEEIDENDELQLTYKSHRYVSTNKVKGSPDNQSNARPNRPSLPNSKRVKHIDKIRLSRIKSGSVVSNEGDISIMSGRRRSSLRESLLRNHLIKKKKGFCSCTLI